MFDPGEWCSGFSLNLFGCSVQILQRTGIAIGADLTSVTHDEHRLARRAVAEDEAARQAFGNGHHPAQRSRHQAFSPAMRQSSVHSAADTGDTDNRP